MSATSETFAKISPILLTKSGVLAIKKCDHSQGIADRTIMFERRPFLGVVGCLTLVLMIWQISPRDVTVYREATSPYLSPSGLSRPSAYGAASSARQIDQQKLPYDSDDSNEIDGRRTALNALPPYGYATNRELSGSSGTSGTFPTNQTSPGWLVAAAAAAVAETPAGTRTDFKFIINHDYCGTGTGGSSGGPSSRRRRSLKRPDALWGTRSLGTASPPLVLVLIHSAPANLVKRNTIRATWGQSDARSRLIFLMGAVDTNASQMAIEQESRLHGDIVQGNFVDAYRNMTYKHVMALKWFAYHCPGAQYVLKTDDDVFINTPVLYNALQRVVPQRNLLLCQLVTKLSVKRTHRSKWFVSWREYPSRYYPPHCPGYSILYSPDVAWKLYREAQRQPFFWIDDVHITGTVAQQVNVTITPMDGLYLDSEAKSDLLGQRAGSNRPVFFFTNPNLSMDEIERLWDTRKLSTI
uniref:Hexosyltransferase n=1 Tax=Anopheles epiroticus TaxID=199890 RepID=A0A182PDR8_9DIPT